MTAPWLSVVGIGEDGMAGLSSIARAAIDEAEVLVGGARHLAMLPADSRKRIVWASPIETTIQEIGTLAGKRVAVIASGDPMWFGIGATLRRSFVADAMRILPAPSAFSLAAARMGWPLHEVECLTVHGRPLERIAAFVQPGAKLLVLSHDRATPAHAAAMLAAVGFGPSKLTALSHLGGDKEEIASATADSWGTRTVADLNTLAIDCIAAPGAKVLARVPGLPDDAFTHDGQLTKRDIRAVTLAALAPLPGQHLWDLGAGCGSIAIEWMRAARGATASAVEKDAARAGLIQDNALALGVPELAVIAGAAPAACAALPKPDAVFIGGGTSDATLIDAAWGALPSGGRIVANAVTLEGEGVLTRAKQDKGGDLVKLEIAQAERLGALTVWRPKLAVVQWRAVKP
jgi:precorrin-6B C5,15-methyltransferase / cobalt-precorrin-6B C5,C15-methyltransferase